jgi:uncharacterized protein YdaU (DUF1376 family)
MARPQFYRFFAGDYLRDAAHLSLLEHGVYRRLIDIYMTTGEPLPFDMPKLYRLLHATSKEEQGAVQQVVEEFFRMDGSLLRHSRCDRELKWQFDLTEQALRANKIRWGRVNENQQLASGRNPDGLLTVSEPDIEKNLMLIPTKNPTLIKAAKVASADSARDKPRATKYPPGFSEFWNAYPRKVGKEKAFLEWKKRRPDRAMLDVMLAAIATQKQSRDWLKDHGEFIPHPSTWLHQGRWLDELGPEREERGFVS